MGRLRDSLLTSKLRGDAAAHPSPEQRRRLTPHGGTAAMNYPFLLPATGHILPLPPRDGVQFEVVPPPTSARDTRQEARGTEAAPCHGEY
jgi:hypothetical protein